MRFGFINIKSVSCFVLGMFWRQFDFFAEHETARAKNFAYCVAGPCRLNVMNVVGEFAPENQVTRVTQVCFRKILGELFFIKPHIARCGITFCNNPIAPNKITCSGRYQNPMTSPLILWIQERRCYVPDFTGVHWVECRPLLHRSNDRPDARAGSSLVTVYNTLLQACRILPTSCKRPAPFRAA